MGSMKDQLGDTPYYPPQAPSPPAQIRDEIPEEVYRLFEAFAFEAIKAGMTRFSSDAILHRLRWSCQIEKGMRDYRVNDHWSAFLSRWFMDKHQVHKGFFETRKRKSEGESNEPDQE